jgi:predicted MPP superfamily phosphohydrolase
MYGASLPAWSATKDKTEKIRFGIVSDVHYAARDPQGDRYYEQSLDKLSECVDVMNKEKVDFLIELGDFKDEGHPPDEKQTLGFLDTIEKALHRFNGPCYHVLGNHDEDSISKQQFLSRIKNGNFPKAENYYSFQHRSFQFIVLDANFTAAGADYEKGNFDWKDCHMPQEQLDWLKDILKDNSMPAVVFIHQRLDSLHSLRNYCPDNADAVRKILEDAGNVLAVFQGHDHRGGFNAINNIPYYTIKGMIEGSGPENNSYAIVEIKKDVQKQFVISVNGYRRAESLTFV